VAAETAKFGRDSNFVRSLFIFSVLAIGFSSPSLAQEGTLLGTITDPSGAAVPNVTITINNVDTGRRHIVFVNFVYEMPLLRTARIAY